MVSLFLALVTVFSLMCMPVSAQEEWKLAIDGVDVTGEVRWERGSLYVPLRTVMQAFGRQVTWDEKNHLIVVTGPSDRLTLDLDESYAAFNSEVTAFPHLIIEDGITYIAFSYLEEKYALFQKTEKDTKRVFLYEEGEAEAFITAKYPIVVIPGTLGCWSSVDYAFLKAHVEKETGNSFANATLSLFRPSLLTMLESAEAMEKSVVSYYQTEVDGRVYYIEPFWDTYAPLCAYLEEHGLVQDEDYFIFGYDTLNVSIEDNALRLRKYIDLIKKQTGAQKVQLVAHSQGGLIARQYIQNLGGYLYVAKFLGVGVPNAGVTYTYPIYDKGTFNPLDGRELSIGLLAYFIYGDFSAASKRQLVHEHSKTIVQMLPTYIDTGELENKFLLQLNSAESKKRLSYFGKQNVLMVTGSGVATIAAYDDAGKSVYESDGDSTTLVKSASLGEGYRLVRLPDTRHADSFRDGSMLYRHFDLSVR